MQDLKLLYWRNIHLIIAGQIITNLNARSETQLHSQRLNEVLSQIITNLNARSETTFFTTEKMRLLRSDYHKS